jgi:hypothetical protein
MRQLAQVKAPDSLWAQIERERRSQQTQSRVRSTVRVKAGWVLWPAVATILLLATGDLAWEVGRARATMRLSDSDLASISAGTGTRVDSSDPAAIRAWVKARTNMDVDLNCGGAGKVQLAGARLINFRDKLVAAISYKLDGNDGLMFVSKKGLVFERARSNAAETRLVSWGGRNRSFSLTYPPVRALDPACVQCHVEGHGQL